MSKTKKDVGAIVHRDGVNFRVWAPFAASVAVTGSFNDWGQEPMVSEGDGYWFVKVKKAEAGQEYKFVINTGYDQRIKNDPRALQVTTTAGNSVIVDPYYDWGDERFQLQPFNRQVLYELHVGTFNRTDPAAPGTFEAATAKLDYLADLGITAVELMPICSMPMDRGWGYAADYLYAVESLYGGRHELLKFVQAAHAKGIGVILDVVYNHFGPDTELDLWQFDGWNENGKGGIYFYNDWRAETPWGTTRPDYGRPEVRQYIFDNVRMWLQDCRLDGLRVDSTIYIRNAKGQNNNPSDDLADGWSLLQRINSIARKINPGALLIAEDMGGNEYVTKSKGEGGADFSSQWEVGFPGVLRAALESTNDAYRNIQGVADILMHRFNGNAFQKVVYSDSHDSAGNEGDSRLNEEISPGNPTSLYARKRSLLAASIVMSAPGIPMLLQGQEFMQGGRFSDWQALDWDQVEQYGGIVDAYRHLISLRKNQYGNTAGLCGQSLAVLHVNDDAKVLIYHRWDQGGPGDDVIVAINFANRKQTDYHLKFPRPGRWTVRFNSSWQGYSPDFKPLDIEHVDAENGDGVIQLAPYNVVILSQDA